MSWNSTTDAVAKVIEERQRQELLKKEGRFVSTLATNGMPESYKLACIVQEIAEVSQILLKRAGLHPREIDDSNSALKGELLQIAALAVAWIEYLEETTTYELGHTDDIQKKN
jgi:hypothetical protein